MRILYLAGRELTYPRNDVLLRAFRRFAEVEVIGVRQRPRSLALTSLGLAARALPRLVLGNYDCVFVGFYGHFLMLPAGLLARQPVLFDAFVSTYDTLSGDRKVIREGSPASRLAFWLDRTACRLAERVLLDTDLHIDYFTQTFGLPAAKFAALPVGCNEDLFSPQPLPAPGAALRVLYYSSYLPLHGVETVVRAAALLRSEPVRFRLIGTGQAYHPVRALARSLGLGNLDFMPPMPLESLPKELAAAEICLGGHFGGTEKGGRVVPGKIYQILATARPLVAGDTPANRALLVDGESALLVPPCDPAALAEAVHALACDPALRIRLAAAGRNVYIRSCSEAVITRSLRGICSA